MKVGLFFGTYNPVHVGHMVIANYMAEFTDLDQVWMVVTPHNPFKEKASMLRDYDRLHLVRLAIGDNLKIKASNIEFDLPQPNYTIDTLTYLKEKNPDKEFVLIMGADNLNHFPKWKNHQEILDQHWLYVYPRIGAGKDLPLESHPKVKFCDAPIMKISSSIIRKATASGKDLRHYMPEKVSEYIQASGLYKQLEK
jgi:nicotinate-nucleotide adenylyltransferase